MRTRQRFTAVGAVTLAAGSIGSGAFVTSSAMADDSTPDKATMTVVSMQAGADEAIRCTFEDVALPPITFEAGEPGVAGFVVRGGGVGVGATPAEGGIVFSADVLDGVVPPPPGAGEPILESAELPADGPSFSVEVAPPTGATPVFVFDDANAREGTPEECAQLEADLPTP